MQNCSNCLASRQSPGSCRITAINDQHEVDFVLESASRELIGIEVKAAASVQASDFKGLRRLREVAGKPFVTGIVLYDGRQALSFGDGFWAVPLNQL